MKTLLLVAGLLLAVEETAATDLRGRVQIRVGFHSELLSKPGIPLRLYAEKAAKQWVRVGTATTDSEGMYQFQNVVPGIYALQVGGANFRLKVQEQSLQDISPITIQR